MASSRGILNIQSLNELTSEKDLRGQYVVKGFARFCVLAFASFAHPTNQDRTQHRCPCLGAFRPEFGPRTLPQMEYIDPDLFKLAYLVCACPRLHPTHRTRLPCTPALAPSSRNSGRISSRYRNHSSLRSRSPFSLSACAKTIRHLATEEHLQQQLWL